MILPTKRSLPIQDNPKLLIIFGKPKSGKTTLLAALDNNLIIDLDDGADYTEAMSIKATTLGDLRDIRAKIIEMGKPYKFLTFDTVTALEDLSLDLALMEYRKTPMGKNFGFNSETGDYENVDIRTLANGGGE